MIVEDTVTVEETDIEETNEEHGVHISYCFETKDREEEDYEHHR